MSRYVKIENGIVHPLEITEEVVKKFRELGMTIIDVEGIIPQPHEGWLYDGTNFTEPGPILNSPVISLLDFWERFTSTEQEDLVDARNKKFKGFLYRLQLLSSVDLTDDKIVTIVNAMETTNLIGSGRAAKILAP